MKNLFLGLFHPLISFKFTQKLCLKRKTIYAGHPGIEHPTHFIPTLGDGTDVVTIQLKLKIKEDTKCQS